MDALPPNRPTVRIGPKALRRIREGHLWIFSNEIHAPDATHDAGTVVTVTGPDGGSCGAGFYHPHSLIAVRLMSSKDIPIGPELFRERIQNALRLRETLYTHPYYRLVHGEADLLPGLIIDRYGDAFVLQGFSAGMELHSSDIVASLTSLFSPRLIIERNESPLRRLEGLPQRKGILHGDGEAKVRVPEGGCEFEADLLHGQKTGFYYDQRPARDCLALVAKDATVLDLCCYEGAFSVRAARAGANRVIGVDVSKGAVDAATKNAELNGVSDRCEFVQADVFDYLRESVEGEKRFDRIVLDPPSFTRSKKEVPAAKKAYLRLNRDALRLLSPGGMLLTASCSHHVFAGTFHDLVAQAAREAHATLQIIATFTHAPDHPILPAMPETQYLKVLLCRRLD